MPYILKSRREAVDTFQIPLNEMVDGDFVYMHYKGMVQKWKENPRFQTAFDIKYWVVKEVRNSNDDRYCTQLLMSYDEFKRRYLDPYEQSKIENPENGDVL